VVAATVVVPPAWARPSFGRLYDAPAAAGQRPEDLPGSPSTAVALTGLVALAAASAGATHIARRRGDRAAVSGIAVAATALLVSVVTVAVIPIGPLGFGPHQVRWLWPLGVFITGVLLLGAIHPRWVLRAALVAAVALSLLSLPAHREGSGPSAGPSTTEASAMPLFRELRGQLGVLEDRGTLLVEVDGLPLFEPYSTPLMLELQRRGIPFVVDHRFTVLQVGRSRRHRDGDAEWAVYVAEGRAAAVPRPGAERVAFVDGEGRRGDVGVFLVPLDSR
jgi:hypothetical protein